MNTDCGIPDLGTPTSDLQPRCSALITPSAVILARKTPPAAPLRSRPCAASSNRHQANRAQVADSLARRLQGYGYAPKVARPQLRDIKPIDLRPMLRLYIDQIARLFPDASKAELWLLLAARRAILKTVPACHEHVKWGALSYQKPDPDGAVKGGICQLAHWRGKVLVGFIHGAFLPDPARLLQGTAKAKRTLPIPDAAFLKNRRFLDLLRASARFDPCDH